MKKTIVDVICGKTPTQHLNNGVNIYSSPVVHVLMKAAAWETMLECFSVDRNDLERIGHVKILFDNFWNAEIKK